MSRADIESQLEQVAAALKTVPLQSEAAWERVRARVQVQAYTHLSRWPLALSMSLVTAMFVVANLGPLARGNVLQPALSAAYVPAPAQSELTPTPVGWTVPAAALDSTVAPRARSRESLRAVTPIPRPPDS